MDTISACTVIVLIQVHLENLLFRVLALKFDGEPLFLQLPLQFLVGRQERLFDELLRDRRTTFGPEAVRQVRDHGAADTAQVNPVMFIEATVLDRDDRLLHHF